MSRKFEIKFKDNNLNYFVFDYDTSNAVKLIYRELNSFYKPFLNKINFEEGDIVLDIGAHVGCISMYIASKFPQVFVYSFEPLKYNFNNFAHGVQANELSNIALYNAAVSNQNREQLISVNLNDNTGGATCNLQHPDMQGQYVETVETIDLNDFYETLKFDKIKLLKIDCEGSEHDILKNFKYLDKVEYLIGEFHINSTLQSQGHNMEFLEEHCLKYINSNKFKIVKIKMAE